MAGERDRHGEEVVAEGEGEVLQDAAAGDAGEVEGVGGAVDAVAEDDEVGGAAAGVDGRGGGDRDVGGR